MKKLTASSLWLSLLLAVIIVQSSCTIQKRRYRDGFYVEYAGKHSQQKKSTAETTESQAKVAFTDAEKINTAPAQTPAQSGKTTVSPVDEKHQLAKHKTAVPDTFLIEEEEQTETNSERVKYLLKHNQDKSGAKIVKEAEVAYWFMLAGIATLIIFGIGPILALVSLIMLLIAQSKLKSADYGEYSSDNYLLIRRTFWPALIMFLLPILFIGVVLILFLL
ncbi:MAG: hypothetical protein ACRC3B_14955 [Bacteroidia bacterium]